MSLELPDINDPQDQDVCSPETFADPDVTGIGVLISYGISVCITAAAIVIAYLMRALRPHRYNAFDELIVSGVHRVFGRTPSSQARKAVVDQRIAAFETFIQTMADTQLFTGLALIVAIYMVRYGVTNLDQDVSAYSYAIAVNIALLCCLTHLCAMNVLHDHFTHVMRMRHVRAFLMVVSMALLLPQFVTSQLLDSELTLRCALAGFDGDPQLLWSDHLYDQTVFFATICVLEIIALAYLRDISQLYFPLCRDSPEQWLRETMVNIVGRSISQATDEYYSRAQEIRLARASSLTQNWEKNRRVQIPRIVRNEFFTSFFFEIVRLSFFVTFAVVQVIFFFVWGPNYETNDRPISFALSFGQVLPLVLLGLPFLSALEIHSAIQRSTQNEGVQSSVYALVGRAAALSQSPQAIVQTGSICLYKSSMRHYGPRIKRLTWCFAILSVVWAMLEAIILTGILWSGNIGVYDSQDDWFNGETRVWLGYILTLIIFMINAVRLISCILHLLCWTWKGHYARVAETRPCTGA